MNLKDMNRMLGRVFLVAGLALGLAGCAREQTLELNKLVVALKPDKNPEFMVGERAALEAFLGKQLGRPVEVVVPLSASTIIEGLANGTIDLGYLSATDMINVRNRGVANVLLAGEFPDGRTAYDSYWVVKADSAHRTIEDLRDRPVAFASRTSTSGFVVPVLDLRERGLIEDDASLEGFFGRGNVFFGIGYVSAVERVLAGEAEAAAISYYVLDLDKHLTEEQRGQLRRLQAQGPVPSHVIAARSTLSADDQARLRTALKVLNEPEHHALRDKLFTTKLVEVDEDAHLSGLTRAIELARRAARP